MNQIRQSAPLEIAVNALITQIDGLAGTLPIINVSIIEAHKTANREFQKFLDERCTKSVQGDQSNYIVPSDSLDRLRHFQTRVARTINARDLIPKSFLVALISQYDAFLGTLVRSLLKVKPEILSASERKLTYQQLSEFKSLESAKDALIDQEIDGLLRKSHVEQFKWLEKTFSVELRKDLPVWKTFVEVTERRNLFVHCNGVVSEQYLSNCREGGSAAEADVKVGLQLNVSQEYFAAAHACILEIGVKLTQVLWRKLIPAELEAADLSLTNIIFDLLSDERWDLAKTVADFSTEIVRKYCDEASHVRMVLNRAQAYKWSGEESRMTKILDEEDWTAKNDLFKLAERVLRDDVDGAVALMKRVGPDGLPSKAHYRDWPIFRNIRKDNRFKDAFKSIFNESLEQVQVTPSGEASAGSIH